MIETTARRDRRTAPTRSRLGVLIDEASPSEPAESVPAGALRPNPWAVDPVSTPPAGDGPATAGLPELGAAPVVPVPWWRRYLDRLRERWWPDRTPDPPRRRLPVLAAGAALSGVFVAVGLALGGTGGGMEAPPALPAAAVSDARPSAPAGSAGPGAGGTIVISVVGRVTTPGLVTVPDGARVADAVAAAGGTPRGVDLGGLNLARRLVDGEQIYVGVRPPPDTGPAAGAPGAGQPGGQRVDLNTASLSTLDTLPGVGPVTAQRIVDWRTRHGRFASVEQLRQIEGIGPSRFTRLKDLVMAG